MEQTIKKPVLSLKSISRVFHQGPRKISVLKGANLDLSPGQCVALVGPSGAGKSTLLHIAGLLERPDSGGVWINGEDCAELSDLQRTRYRRQYIGVVYQFHQLLGEFSALENIVIPQLINGVRRGNAENRARDLLRQLGLIERVDHRPAELSGGEQQRVAIARSVANNPHVLLADEPTGNLDPQTAERVFIQLLQVIQTTGLGAIIATHNFDLAARMDRIVKLDDGRLIDVTAQMQPGPSHQIVP